MFLNTLQKINNTIYKLTGLNSITLKVQVYINTKRNKNDEPDKNLLNNEGYLQ